MLSFLLSALYLSGCASLMIVATLSINGRRLSAQQALTGFAALYLFTVLYLCLFPV